MYFWYLVWVILWINSHMNAKKCRSWRLWWICNVNVWGWIPQKLARFGGFRPLHNQNYSQNFVISKNRQCASLRNWISERSTSSFIFNSKILRILLIMQQSKTQNLDHFLGYIASHNYIANPPNCCTTIFLHLYIIYNLYIVHPIRNTQNAFF